MGALKNRVLKKNWGKLQKCWKISLARWEGGASQNGTLVPQRFSSLLIAALKRIYAEGSKQNNNSNAAEKIKKVKVSVPA